MSRLIAPRHLLVGRIYEDREGTRYGVLERDLRGGARLISPPEDAPNWHGVTLDPDGAWWQGEQRVARDPYLEETGGFLVCGACRRFLKASPRTAEINHDNGCAWLAAARASGPEDAPHLPAPSLEDWDPNG